MPDLIDIDEVTAAEALMAPAQEVAVVEHVPTEYQEREVVMTDPVLAQAAAIARLPGLNEGMFNRLMEWQDRERAAQAEERFNDAMNRAQAEIAPVARTAQNTQVGNFYAKLEAVDAAIRPIYLAHGFNVAYNTVPPLTAGHIRVECEVSLGRHSKKYYREAPADTLGPKGAPVKTILHGGGSTETFLKRYAVTGAFNVVFRNLDDDGNKGGAQYIDDNQVETLQTLLSETKTNMPEFFRVMISEELFEINEVQQKDFARLANALQRKKHQMARKKPAEGDAP